MGKGKGGGGGGAGGNAAAAAGGNAAQPNRKVEMTIKVLLEVREQETREEKRVAIRSSDGSVVSFNPFPGQHPQLTAFRKR